jgi:hypothetical protein
MTTRALALSLLLTVGCGSGTMSGADGGTSSGRDGSTPPDASRPRDAGTFDAGPRECPLRAACDADFPAFGETRPWIHTTTRLFTITQGDPRHRGRDLFVPVGAPQWAIAKLAYGLADDDLKDEEVDVYLERDCSGVWEPLGTVRTTDEGDHPTVEGVEDSGGRVFLDLASVGVTLDVGRHRVLFVVAGDHSTATQILEVLPTTSRFVVTDVDGTQTESETAEWGALLTGSGPAAQPDGAALLTAFARRGYHVLYLTARPEWLAPRTHAWLAENGYPPGIVHTTLGLTGALGGQAETFKTNELRALVAAFPGGLYVGIGNTDSDVAAYAAAGLPPERSWIYRHDPGAVGTRVDDYGTRIAEVEALAALCR